MRRSPERLSPVAVADLRMAVRQSRWFFRIAYCATALRLDAAESNPRDMRGCIRVNRFTGRRQAGPVVPALLVPAPYQVRPPRRQTTGSDPATGATGREPIKRHRIMAKTIRFETIHISAKAAATTTFLTR